MRASIALLVLITALCGSSEAWAAKCKYQWETVNYRTGEKVQWTNWIKNRAIINMSKPYGAVAGVSEGNRKFLGLQIISPAPSMDTRPTKADLDAIIAIPAEAKLSIFLADGARYDLFAERAVTGDASFAVRDPKGYTLTSEATVRFELDAAALAALNGQKATGLRLHTPSRDFDISFGKKPSDKIQKVLACIL